MNPIQLLIPNLSTQKGKYIKQNVENNPEKNRLINKTIKGNFK
jgi:hypothetical protein